jgi:hypothetical protein
VAYIEFHIEDRVSRERECELLMNVGPLSTQKDGSLRTDLIMSEVEGRGRCTSDLYYDTWVMFP